MIRLRPPALALALAGLLAGCATPPPVQHYTLGPPAVPAEGPPPGSAAPATTASLVIGPVSVPAAIDRLPMLRRLAGSRVEVADSHRWAAPLKTEIARRVAGELARRTPYTQAVGWPRASLDEPALSVTIDVQRFDAEGFERVGLEAVWTLREAGQTLASRRFSASRRLTAPGWDALAAAHGELVDALAADIARALPAPRPD